MARRKQRRQRQRKAHPVVQPAPFLFRERVVLEDIVTVTGDANSGSIACQVNANGYTGIAPSGVTESVPQSRLWDQYAGMYDYYQVKGISFTFIPFRFQGPINGASNDLSIIFPTFTIIDPDNTFATVGGAYTESSLYSFGNCKAVLPYKEHHRSMSDYTNLGISKQDTLILKTNGSANSREKYTTPASICFLTSSPTFEQKITGYVTWKIVYEFSGRKAPGVLQPGMPLPKQPVCNGSSGGENTIVAMQSNTYSPKQPAHDQPQPQQQAMTFTSEQMAQIQGLLKKPE